MFTGLIQEVGKIHSLRPQGDGLTITVYAPEAAPQLQIDDSIAINGVCQTVTAVNGSHVTVQAVEETLRKTTFGSLKQGASVNLELAMRLSDRLGGHLVLGHIDGVGIVESIATESTSWLVTIKIPSEFLRYVIPVGSIAIDGISLTVARLDGERITVAIIPHTYHHTIVQYYHVGSRVNLEFDIIGKYIERLLHTGSADNTLSLDQLKLWGYGKQP